MWVDSDLQRFFDVGHYTGLMDSMEHCVGTNGVSQLYHLCFDDNKVLKIINWILLKVLFKCT